MPVGFPSELEIPRHKQGLELIPRYIEKVWSTVYAFYRLFMSYLYHSVSYSLSGL